MATRPTITINFKQLATTLIQRSERGTAILFLADNTIGEEEGLTKCFVYRNVSQVNSEYDGNFFDEEGREVNLKHIKRCFLSAPYEVIAIIAKDYSKLATFTNILTSMRTQGWITIPDDTLKDDLASWIKSMEKDGFSYKAIGNKTGVDCKHYVYFSQAATSSDGEAFADTEIMPYLLGVLAGCNCTRSVTNYKLSELSSCEDVEDIDEAIKAGQLVITNVNSGVKIVTGINSLTTLNGNTETEDMQYIETVEAMDLIRDDIRDVFANTYQGSFKNKYMNQMLFIGAVNEYFDSLAAEDILDSEFNNKAEIDVDAQRSAWVGTGKSEAEEWDEDTVKRRSFKRSVFIASNIKILNSMENLKFTVTME